jgi:hypothetical protein
MESSLKPNLAVVAARGRCAAIIAARGPGTPVVAAGAAWCKTLFALKQFCRGVAFTPILASH